MDQTQHRHRQATGLLSLFAAVLIVAAASLAQAQTTASYWNVTGPADWSQSGNWALGTFPGYPIDTYLANGTVVNNGGTATITAGDNVSDNTATGNIFVGGSGYIGGSGGNGFVIMSGGTLGPAAGQTYPTTELLGNITSSGVFTQSGGINCPFAEGQGYVGGFTSLQLGPIQGGYGEYNLSGGSLGVNAIYVGGNNDYQGYTVGIGGPLMGGTGVFTQTGGSVGRFGSGAATQSVGLMVGGGAWCKANNPR